MTNLDILCRLLEMTRKLGADAADGIFFETSDVSRGQRMGKPEGLERSENKALSLRAFAGDKQASVSSTDTHPDALKELAERAVAMARAATPDPESRLAPKALYPQNIPDLDLVDEKEPDSDWMVAQCKSAEEAALAVAGITNSEGADASYSISSIGLAINGPEGTFAKDYRTSQLSLSVSVLAGEGTGMQRDYDFTYARHRSDLKSAENIGKEAGKRAIARLNPRKIATQTAPVIFDPRVSKSLVSTLAGAVSGSSVARGSSFLKDAMGKDIFAKGVSIIDDPLMKRGLASKPFDGEGVAVKKLALVENGELKNWILDMRTATKLNLATNGRASRGLGGPPSPSSTNLYMQPGRQSPKELMKGVTGLYLTETFGMGVSIVTGDYSQGAAGFWIENGEIAYPVSEITIAGKLQDMFATLVPANDLEFRYGTNAPTILVPSMTIAGS